jgi:hypothetical protein
VTVTSHHIDENDVNWAPGVAKCECGWSSRATTRNERMGAAYRHLADVIDPVAPPVIIGFGHMARTGKSAAARILVDRHGFVERSMVEKVNAVIYATNAAARELVDRHGWEGAKDAHPSVRRAQEDMGAALRKHFGSDVLIRDVLGRCEPAGRYVVPNVRFPEEAKAILGLGGKVVRIDRPGAEPAPGCRSERALAAFDGWSAVISNDGTLDDLAARVAALV